MTRLDTQIKAAINKAQRSIVTLQERGITVPQELINAVTKGPRERTAKSLAAYKERTTLPNLRNKVRQLTTPRPERKTVKLNLPTDMDYTRGMQVTFKGTEDEVLKKFARRFLDDLRRERETMKGDRYRQTYANKSVQPIVNMVFGRYGLHYVDLKNMKPTELYNIIKQNPQLARIEEEAGELRIVGQIAGQFYEKAEHTVSQKALNTIYRIKETKAAATIARDQNITENQARVLMKVMSKMDWGVFSKADSDVYYDGVTEILKQKDIDYIALSKAAEQMIPGSSIEDLMDLYELYKE